MDVDTTAGVSFSATQDGGDVLNASEVAGGVELTGQTLPGSTVVITKAGGGSYTATVAADGSWSVQIPAGDFASGEYEANFTATATSPVGNVASADLSVDVDTVVRDFALDANAKFAADGDQAAYVLNGDEVEGGLTLTGTTEPGATVQVKLGNVTKTATVNADGSWSVDFAAADIPAGEYSTSMTITSTDLAGNTKEMVQGVTVDTIAGDVALSSQPVELDDVINATEAADGVILSGTATPGMDVTVSLNGVSKTVTSSATGQWSAPFASNEVAAGEYEANISASITDANGNSKTVTDKVEVDTLVNTLTMTSDPVAGDNVINAQELADGVTLSGTVEAGSTVEVKIGDNPAKSATVDAAGNWSVDFGASDVTGGELSSQVVVTAKDAAGNTLDLSKDVKIDTIVRDLSISDTPVEGNDVVNADELADGLTFTGTTEPGSTVMVKLNSGAEIAADVDASGNWTVDFDANQVPDTQGNMTLTVTATDAAGNVGTATDSFVLDTVAPDAPEANVFLNDADGSISGVFNSDANLTLEQLNADGTVSDTPGFDLNTFYSTGGMPDGSRLVLTETDAAQNATSTLIVTEDGGANLDLSAAGLSDYNIEAIDLLESFEANTVTITEDQLLSLSDNSNVLTIHGGDQDTVNVNGASNTGTTVEIGGNDYHVYTLGDAGGVLHIQEDIQVNTVI